jgi:hypothetical protein
VCSQTALVLANLTSDAHRESPIICVLPMGVDGRFCWSAGRINGGSEYDWLEYGALPVEGPVLTDTRLCAPPTVGSRWIRSSDAIDAEFELIAVVRHEVCELGRRPI